MQRLKVVSFSDGRPGHIKQTQGIVGALKMYVELEVKEFEVDHNNLLQEGKNLIAFFLRLLKSPCLGYHPDIIIGTGSRTHIPVLNCKRASQAKTVVCMAPSPFLRPSFDLCLVPVHDRLTPAANIFQTIGPPNNVVSLKKHRTENGLILVGGVDEKSHYWNETDIIGNIQELLAHSQLKSWVISSSPRTPRQTEELLQELAAEKGNVAFHCFSDTGKGWIEQQYNKNLTVWITADSISMVYEALSAGCRVGILPVTWKKKRSKFSFSESYLVDQKRVISYRDWCKGTGQWTEDAPLNEADRCAREILKRWWPESLR